MTTVVTFRYGCSVVISEFSSVILTAEQFYRLSQIALTFRVLRHFE